MAIGPNGERCPDDDVACAVTVAKIAVGEITEKPSSRRTVLVRRSGSVLPERRASD